MNDRDTLLLGGLALVGLGGIAYATSRKPSGESPRTTETPKQLGGTKRRKSRRIGSGPYWAQTGSTTRTDDIETLARVITSEAGSQSLAEKQAIAWVARNKSVVRRTPLVKFLGQPFGKQGARMANGKRRTFSTRQAATPASREIATQVLNAPQSADPTQSATSAFEPKLQDRLFNKKRYRRNAEMLRAEWHEGGGHRVGRIGRWELWAQRAR